MMNVINVSCDKQVCAQCGKSGKGYFEARNAPGKYICHKCVIGNIDKKINSKKSEQVQDSENSASANQKKQAGAGT